MLIPEYKITLTGMHFHSYHGCYELERKTGTNFVVNITITTPLGDICATDNIEHSVNYLTVYQIVREQMAISQKSIEAVANNIIEAIHTHFEQIKQIECCVAKIAPPLGGKVDSAAVTLVGKW